MFELPGNSRRSPSSISRRRLLQLGSLGWCGAGLPDLLASDAIRDERVDEPVTFGKAKSCICLFLYGAWSQLDTLDMKPAAPTEVRGEFQPISTSLTGVQICEHLPRLSRWMDRLTLVRSLTHPFPTHCVAYALSGIPQNPLRDPRDYWPFFSSTLDYLWDRNDEPQSRGIPRQMCLPFPLNSHSTNRSHRGLTPAWLGAQYAPLFGEFQGRANRERGYPSADGANAIHSRFDPFDGISRDSTFRFSSNSVTSMAPKVGLAHKISKTGIRRPDGVTRHRFQLRRRLQRELVDLRKDLLQVPSVNELGRFQRLAYDMIASGGCERALDVNQEPMEVREKYGFTLFGQSTLAARRLVEAGVRVVTVYWDEFGPANTAWDTHVNNFPRLKDGLCPTLDQVYCTLLEDLEQRGLLDETLVLLMSEHGRTPQIGAKPGGAREHWSSAYCGMFAGAGIRQGQVVGATDRQAGHAVDRPVDPKDILATVYHLMGVDSEVARTYDLFNRPHPLLPFGTVVPEMLS
ncbi:MAG: DUF1501 domain-containing protein [Planctomycetota bacterium]|nr:DUF1501 domain-containing protein [Planctomycetota bacterium]